MKVFLKFLFKFHRACCGLESENLLKEWKWLFESALQKFSSWKKKRKYVPWFLFFCYKTCCCQILQRTFLGVRGGLCNPCYWNGRVWVSKTKQNDLKGPKGTKKLKGSVMNPKEPSRLSNLKCSKKGIWDIILRWLKEENPKTFSRAVLTMPSAKSLRGVCPASAFHYVNGSKPRFCIQYLFSFFGIIWVSNFIV